MKYAYYPGCSLTESAREYDAATRAVMTRLGAELTEIPDWTCCGASAVEAVSKLLTYALPARNLALAERELPGQDVLIPCSACYLNHVRALRGTVEDRRLRDNVREVLAAEGLVFQGSGRARHLLDVLVNDVGLERLAEETTHPLAGIVVAPYYGCQAVRPYVLFDDPEQPQTMTGLIEALGAEVLPWNKGASCCGASLMATHKDVALASVAEILKAAQQADVIVTVCPMCQINLEAYQKSAFRLSGQEDTVSVLYLPQLMGLAFGLTEETVMLAKNLSVNERFLVKIRGTAAPAAPFDPARARAD